MIANPILRASLFKRNTGICASGTAQTAAYLTALAGVGASIPSVAVQTALSTLYCSILSAGLDVKVKYMQLFVPNDINTVNDSGTADSKLYRYPYITVLGAFDSTGTAPSATGFSTINGVAGGSSHFNSNTVNVQQPSSLIGWFAYCTNVTATGFTIGAYNGANGMIGAVKHSDNNLYSYNGSISANVISFANTTGAGWYSAQRTSLTDHRVYFANAGTAHAQLGATDTVSSTGLPSLTCVEFGEVDGGALQFPTSDRYSCLGICAPGLTSAEDASLFSIVDTYRRTVGGGFV